MHHAPGAPCCLAAVPRATEMLPHLPGSPIRCRSSRSSAQKGLRPPCPHARTLHHEEFPDFVPTPLFLGYCCMHYASRAALLVAVPLLARWCRLLAPHGIPHYKPFLLFRFSSYQRRPMQCAELLPGERRSGLTVEHRRQARMSEWMIGRTHPLAGGSLQVRCTRSHTRGLVVGDCRFPLAQYR